MEGGGPPCRNHSWSSCQGGGSPPPPVLRSNASLAGPGTLLDYTLLNRNPLTQRTPGGGCILLQVVVVVVVVLVLVLVLLLLLVLGRRRGGRSAGMGPLFWATASSLWGPRAHGRSPLLPPPEVRQSGGAPENAPPSRPSGSDGTSSAATRPLLKGGPTGLGGGGWVGGSVACGWVG